MPSRSPDPGRDLADAGGLVQRSGGVAIRLLLVRRRVQAGLLTLVVMAGIGWPAPVAAHHYSVSSYDGSKAILLTGVLTRFEWTNPHSHFYIDVSDARGNVASWLCEAGTPADLARRGLRRGDVKAGDVLKVEGYRAKDGSKSIIVLRVTLRDGRTVVESLAGRESGKQP